MRQTVFPPAVVTVKAHQTIADGQIVCTLIGCNALGLAVWATTLTRELP